MTQAKNLLFPYLKSYCPLNFGKSHQISWFCCIPNGSYKEDNLKEGRICPPPPMWNRVKVVSFLKKRYPHSIFTATLGENQCTSVQRIESYKKGYLRGSPDLTINNIHKQYTGFAIEFKNPNGKGILSYDQPKMLRQCQNNGFKTLVSNYYDYIIEQLIVYFRDVRIKCLHYSRKFISSQSFKNHIKNFHKTT